MTTADKEDSGFTRLLKQLKDLKELLAGFALAIGALAAVYNWCRDKPAVATDLSIAAFGLICFATCLYAYRNKRLPRNTLAERVGEEGGPQPEYTKRLRAFALVSMAVAVILVLASVGECLLDWIEPPKKTIILVADFDGPDPLNNRLTVKLLTELQKEVKPFPEIEVQPLKETIREEDGMTGLARSKGQERKASIVIWGSYGNPGGVSEASVHFELLGKKMTRLSDTTADFSLSVPQWLELRQKTITETQYVVLFSIGLAKYAAHDFDGAVERLGRALAQQIELTPDPVALDGFLFHGLAELKRRRPDPDAAIQDFKEIISRKPNFAAYNNLGIAYALFKRNPTLSIPTFREALNLEQNPAGYLNVGVVENHLNRLDDALKDLGRAIQLSPDFAPAHSERCLVMIKQGKLDEAIKEGETAVHLADDFATGYNNLGLAKLQKAKKQGGNLDQAIADLTQALKLDPKKEAAFFNRGNAYFELAEREGRTEYYNKALKDYNRAIDIRETYAKPHAMRAIVEYKFGDYEGSKRDQDRYEELIRRQESDESNLQ
jgi:tetratricopeptide (TPR) repeat protein